MKESSAGSLLYCCISRNGRVLYSYNAGDRDLEALASRCLEKTPPFHSHYFHTAGGRTFAFLIDASPDVSSPSSAAAAAPLTYFAIVDNPQNSPDKRKILQLLHQIKNGFRKSSSNFDDELVPVIKRLICSLESMNRSNLDTRSESYAPIDASISTKAPLLGRSGSMNSVKIDLAAAAAAESNNAAATGSNASTQQKSLSFSSRNRQQIGKKLWWRYVKIVVAADVFLCLVLFGIWLAICRGFECLS